MRRYGFFGIVLSTMSIAGGMLLGVQWNKATQLPYNLSIILSLSNAFWNYVLLGILESLSLLLSFYFLQRAHIVWTILGLLSVVSIATWIAGTISLVGTVRVQPFTYPVPIFLVALWLGMFALSSALHLFAKRA